jgi:hypothetical protein
VPQYRHSLTWDLRQLISTYKPIGAEGDCQPLVRNCSTVAAAAVLSSLLRQRQKRHLKKIDERVHFHRSRFVLKLDKNLAGAARELNLMRQWFGHLPWHLYRNLTCMSWALVADAIAG